MTDTLMQITERGARQPDGSFDLRHRWQHPVPAANRLRILDREKRWNCAPSPDGWLWCHDENLGWLDELGADLIMVARVRWEDLRVYAPEDRVSGSWTFGYLAEAAS